MKIPTTIYVVRHGQTEFNVKGIIGGTLEPNLLSERGKEQAIQLGKSFKDVKIDKIYSSDLSRAKSTANAIASIKSLSVETNELLRERNWAELQGKTWKEAQKKYPEVFLRESKIKGKNALSFKYVKDMESLQDTASRFKSFLKMIVEKHRGETMLVVCHFDIMIGYLVYLGFGSYQRLMNASFNHTGYYKLVSDGKSFKVEEIIGLNTKK